MRSASSARRGPPDSSDARLLRCVLTTASALALVACGTTVPATQRGAAAQGGNSLDGTGTGAAAGATASNAPATGVDTGSGPAATSPTAGGPQGATGAGSPAARTVGIGRAGLVNVGWVVLKSNASTGSSLGLSSSSTPDQTSYARIVIDWVNAHGGLGGRQVRPVFDHMDASGSSTLDQYGATACAIFTQDNHVDVVVDPTIGGGSPNLVSCLDAHHVVHVDTTGALDDDTTHLASHRLFLPVASVAVDTLASLEVSALAVQGFYSKGSTPGLITYDEPVFHAAVETVLKPQLKAQTGITLQDANITYLPRYSQISDVAPISAAVSNAVLKYQTQGVNRVIFLQNFSLATLIFMRTADNQHYYPHYGLSSNDSPQTLVGLAPASQLTNAVGFGFRPVYDVTSAQQLQPGRPKCIQIFRAKGLTFSAGDASEAAALRHCEGALVLKAAMDASAGTTGLPLAEVAETGLAGYRAATVLGISITRQHHDGVSIIRDLAYFGSCGCFRYTSAPLSIR